MKKLYLILCVLLAFTLAPCFTVNAKSQNSRSTGVYLNHKKVNKSFSINLDSEADYVRLKGKYKNCSLRTSSKKIKLRYWDETGTYKEWGIVGKKSGKAKIRVVKGKQTLRTFTVKINKPRIVVKGNKTCATLVLKGVGYDNNTIHKVKWYFTPVGHYGNQSNTIVESDNFNKTFLLTPGRYKVKAKHLGKTYKLKKTVLVHENNNDFEVTKFEDLVGVIPEYVVRSLKQHKYRYDIVNHSALAQFETYHDKGWVVNGIHDVESRRIAVCNTSSTIALHEVGHFVSCSFQKVNGINLTQTPEWKRIYEEERLKYQNTNDFSQVGDTYAATSPNEFFAECFQQFYLNPAELRKNCPHAHSFIKRTMEIDFPKIASINW